MATATRTSKKAIGSIRKTATLHAQHTFCTFLCRHFTTTTANSITRRFMEDVNTPRRIFFSPFKLGFGPHEFIYREIKLHFDFFKWGEIFAACKTGHISIIAENLKRKRCGRRRRRCFNLAFSVLASIFWLASSSGPGDEGKKDELSSLTAWCS